jgi:hypothetical protein
LSTSSEGYSEILDYIINMAETGGSFSVLASTVDLNYLAVGLTSGTTYEFKIEARNIYGYSEYSSVLSLFCAFIPTVPTDV